MTMRTSMTALFLAAVALTMAGCAAGFHAGGRNSGVDAGAAIGREPVIVAPPVTHP
jgi:hypothetical protein